MRPPVFWVLLVLAFRLPMPDDAFAAPPEAREWAPVDPWTSAPVQTRLRSATPPITWVRVHPSGQSPCAPADTAFSPDGQTIERVWCFEGPGGDSTWPAIPPAQGTGRHATFDHYSIYNPPSSTPNWHATEFFTNPFDTGNDYNAWCGCSSNDGCAEGAFFASENGYGNNWNRALLLDCSGHTASGGGTIRFDLRYDTECEYDYAVLEYETSPGSGSWNAVRNSQGKAAHFSGVSGQLLATNCSVDYFGHDRQGQGGSAWLNDVVFPIPAGISALRLRWRAVSDLSVSDADSSIDSDGIVAIDDVVISFADGSSVTDDFATGDLEGVQDTGTHSAASSWSVIMAGSQYDGWHLGFNPSYANQGNSCQFSNDWMWAAKPAVGPILANGFDFLLVTPVIDVDGWSGAVIEFSEYACAPDSRNDFFDRIVRYYHSPAGWSSWQGLDPFIHFGGCSEWEFNRTEDLSPFLGSAVDSLQVGFRLIDLDIPGDLSWGLHAQVNYLIDNVSIGSFDLSGTYFIADEATLFQDTFSLGDPAHSAGLRNDEQGEWIGSGGLRPFAAPESLTVDVRDRDGVTEGNVVLWWRHDNAGAGFGSWNSVPMNLSLRIFGTNTDEGTYRAILGADDGGDEDLTPAGDDRIWLAGTTVDYYIRVTDDLSGVATHPAEAANPSPSFFEFSVLPLFRTTPAQNSETYLLVNDTGRDLLDYENSIVSGPVWTAVYARATALTECGLLALGIQYDRYDVQENLEPPGLSDPAARIGGFLDEFGAPLYDCVIWIHGDLGDSTFSADSRVALREHLDNGGLLLAAGDGIAKDLAGDDPTFLRNYLGAATTTSPTASYVLNARGEPGTSVSNLECGLFGNCPTHRSFDRLTLATPIAGQSNQRLMTYRDGAPSDEGTGSVIKNVSAPGAGTSVLAGFDLSALLSCNTRTCLLETLLEVDLGRTIPVSGVCINNGVGAPDLAAVVGFSLGQAAPNPFSTIAVIPFAVPRAGAVTLELYDVRGRKIRTLVDERLEARGHTSVWDGRTSSGSLASNGMYFYRLKAAGEVATGRVVLLR